MQFFKTTGQPINKLQRNNISRNVSWWITTSSAIEVSLYPRKYLIITWHGISPSTNCILTSGILFNILHGSQCIGRLVILQFNWHICIFAIYSFQMNIIYACLTRMPPFINTSTHIYILLYCFWYVKHIAGLKSVVYCSFEMWNISRVMLKEMQLREIYLLV